MRKTGKIAANTGTTSRINTVKTRMHRILLQDRAGLDDGTAQLVREALGETLASFFAAQTFACDFEPQADGSIVLTLRARVTRLPFRTR